MLDAHSTAADVLAGVDLTGTTAIVTGGSAGLGLETTRALATAGATVVVGARDVARGQAALRGVPRVEIWPLDLVDPASVDAFADRFLATGRPLHVLVNNAGIGKGTRQLDARGYELTFATNHLGHFQLTLRLHPALIAAHGARVVNVSSGAHALSDIRWDDLHFATGFEGHLAYGQSKAANVLFTVELDRRWAPDGIRSFSLHPGISVATTLADPRKDLFTPAQLRDMGLVDASGTPIIDPKTGKKTPAQGAATIVFAAASPVLADRGGLYLENCAVAATVAPHAIDPASARRLWDVSERLTSRRS